MPAAAKARLISTAAGQHSTAHGETMYPSMAMMARKAAE